MTRLFHTILPIPECCRNTQMALRGNWSLHEVEYECTLCLKRVRVRATFDEEPNRETTPAQAAQADDTP